MAMASNSNYITKNESDLSNKNLPQNSSKRQTKSKLSSRDYVSNHNIKPMMGINQSEKELRRTHVSSNSRVTTAYERTNKWVNQSAGGGYDFYKKQGDFRKEFEPKEVKSKGINGIIS